MLIRLLLRTLLFVIVIPTSLFAQDIQITASFGKLDGDETEVFGKIQGAAFAGEDLFIVLDSRMLELRLLNANGTVLSHTGRFGEGPGEFSVPEALVPLPGGAAVLDRRNARITIYEISDSLTLEMKDEIPLSFQAWDLCFTEDRIFLASDSRDTPIIEINLDGEVVQAFGEAADPPRMPMDTPGSLRSSLDFQARRGRLDCSEAGLTWASIFFGGVSHYSLDGDELFSTSLPGFEPVSPQLTERRTVRYGPRKGVSYKDGVKNVVHLGRFVLVQALRIDYGARTRTIESWIVDLATGSANPYPGLGLLVRDVNGGMVLFSRDDPFPQLLLGTWHPPSGLIPGEDF